MGVIAGFLLVVPAGVKAGPASHDPWKLKQVRVDLVPLTDAPGQCEACHTLNASDGETGTSFINSTARTLAVMKIAKSGAFVATESFGCTFCHSNQTSNTTMDDVLTDFEFTTIKHPIGRKLNKTNTNNEYLSTYGTAAQVDELQCNNCHQMSLLTYPYHEGRPSGDPAQWTGTWDKTVNPYGLQNVVAAGDNQKKHCLDTCHSDAPVGGNSATRPKMGHYGWGGYVAATNTIYDPSGQALQAAATASCAVCHDTHTSEKASLLQDGLDRGTADGKTAINDTNCTAACHAAGAFSTHGHGGKVGINATLCTPCHDSSVSHRDTTSAATVRRLGMVYEGTAMSNLALARNADGLDNDMNGTKDDETAFVYSKNSICKTCHINYAGHGSGARAAGCMDCHDVHGDAAVANNNAAMIRSSVFGENTVFTAADRTAKAYYKGAGNSTGACDNDACHSNIAGGLETAHKGGTGAVLAQPCTDCHNISHSDPQFYNTDGSFMVTECTGCHFAGADANNWNIADGTASKISSSEWTSAGHGRTTTFASGNPAAGFAGPSLDSTGCAYCHDGAVGHGTASNPFRLANKGATGTVADQWNKVCLVCHKAADAGYDPDGTGTNYASVNGTLNVDENHYGSSHSALTQGGAFCWDCHDPHGDAQHLMAHSGDGSAAGLGVTSVSDGAYGVPTASRTVTGLDVVAGGYTSGDLANAANTGLCQTCHAASGGASYYTRSLFTPLASHNGADSTLCTGCHQHTRDFGAGCNTCHGDVGGLIRGDASAFPPEGPTASRNPGGQNWAETAATAATVGHHQKHLQSYGTTACSTCHTATPGTGGTHNDNGANATMTGIATYGTWAAGALAGTTSTVDDTCANMTCHASTYGAPANVYRSPANPGYVRYWNSNLDCYSCHAYDGAADSATRPGNQSTLTADWLATGSHDAHINKSTGYTITCVNCHPATGYTVGHKNGSVNFVTNFGATRLGANLGGNYDDNGSAPYATLTPVPSAATSQYYCGNVYCHSTGEPRGGEPIAYSNARWANAGTADCGDCHAVDAAVGSMTTNVHEKHTGSAAGQYTHRCEKCHSGIVAWGGAVYTVSDRALHVNNTNNVNFGTNEGTYAAAGGDCTATYCHSQGLDWTAPYTTAANAPLRVADWDSAAGTLGCYGCHGDGAAVAYPTYANNLSVNPGGAAQTKKNSHAVHGGYTCNQCHNTTTTTGATITTPSNHTDKVWQVAQGGGSTFTVSVLGNMTANVYTATSCTNISCHGGGTAQWGGTLACGDCHNAAADVNDWNIANGTMSKISSAEWTSAGHGRTTAYPGGNAAATFAGPAGSDPQGCAYCHSFLATANNPLVTHNTGTNPFRLANFNALGNGAAAANGFGWNDVCLVCHKAGDAGYDPDGATATYTSKNGTLNVDENHYGSLHTDGTHGGTFCWDCHDPHGDANHLMVHTTVTDVTDAAYGIPASTRAVTGLDVTAAGYTSGDLANAANTGLCQTCHAAAAGAGYYTRSLFTALASHNGADSTLCTSCHQHAKDFGAGCTTCHGDIGGTIRGDGSYYPPEGPVASRGTGTQIWAETASTAATVGHHQRHVQSYGTSACSGCHTATPGTGGTHNDNGANATMTNIATYGTWAAGALAGTASVVDDTCANMTCHTSTYGAPANVYQSPANPGYIRYWNSNLDCYSCHAYNGAADSPTRPGNQSTLTADWMATGSHDAHINKSTGYTVACTDCHPATGYTTAHKNGSVNFVTNFGTGRLGANLGGHYDADGIASFITATPTPSAATSQYYCANVYCHSGGEPRGAEPIAYSAARWANAGTADCGDCHAVDAAVGSMTTNVHEKHTGSAAGQYTHRCEKCHSGIVAWGGAVYTVSDRALHVNNSNNVSFGTNEGTYAAAGDCSATYCHSQGLDWTPPYTTTANGPLLAADWDSGTGSLGCYGCHGDGAAVAYPTYANNLSVNPGGAAQTKKNSHAVHGGYTCNQCHNSTTTTGNTITTPSNHTDKVWQVAQGGSSTFTVSVLGNMTANVYTATSCTNISCHGSGSAQWGATLACGACHNAATDTNDWNIANGTISKISSTEWTSAGHGRTAAYPGGNAAASFAGPAGSDPQGCAYCHSFLATAENPLVTHSTGTNPFRLANFNALGNGSGADNGFGWNDVCLVCHLTGDSGYDPDGGTATYTSKNGTLNVDQNHYGILHSAGTQGGTFCWDCHDPHGDANHLMIHATVADVTDGAYGAPASTRAVTGLDVTTGGYTSGDLANAANTGLCQTCHAASGGASYFTRSLFTALASHNGANATLCTTCHLHTKDFAAEQCESCHDSSPYVKGAATAPNVMGTGGTLAGAYGSPYDDAAYGFNVNGHGRDADTAGVSHGNAIGLACTACHDMSQESTTHLNGTLNGRISPDTRTTNSFHLKVGFVSASTSGNVVQQTFDAYCTATCHPAGIQYMNHLSASDPAPNYAEFGTHNSFAQPANAPPPEMFYEKNLKNLTIGVPNYALCVSCHNPHGTNSTSPRADLNNKMMIYRWQTPATLCSRCHL